MPCHADPMPRSTSLRAASSWKARRVTCSPDSALALDSAGPVGAFVPGLRSSPGIPRAMRRTPS